MKVSVITICFNAEKIIEKTIVSVLNQTYSDIEYIIIDGSSKDHTMDVVNKYASKITKIISEPDGGIYYAMNKGIEMCTGEWCLFMNAGDCFYDSRSVENVMNHDLSGYDVIYGNTEYIYDTGAVVLPPKSLPYVLKGSFCCHQSTFFKVDVLRVTNYDVSYRIIADWVLYRNLYIDNKKFLYVDEIIASYDNIEGASTAVKLNSYIKHEREIQRCLQKSNIISLYFGAYWFYIRRKIIIPLIPNALYKKLKGFWVKYDVKRKTNE